MFTHEIVHFLSCITVGIVFAKIYKNWHLIIYSFLAGFFLDIDHLIDYFIFKHGFFLNLQEFLSSSYFDASNKVYLFFHGYEYAIIGFMVGLIILKNNKRIRNATAVVAVILVAAVSMFFHLVYDQISYRPKFLTYSIIYRASYNFTHDSFWIHN